MSSSRDSSISVAQRCNLQEGTRKSFSHSDLGHFFPQVYRGEKMVHPTPPPPAFLLL